NPRGETTVRASRDGRIHLVAVKILRHSERRGAAELSRATTLEADPQSGVLRLSVRYPQRRAIPLGGWGLVKGIEIPEIEVRLALEVPPATRVTLQSASGDLRTAGLSGHQELTSSSGDIDVADATGLLRIDTRSGDATLESIGAAAIGSTS